MLVDFIGIAAAIAAMMLLLSLIVSALSELTQAIFRVRGRNLQYGLACALAVEGNKPDRTNRLEAMEIKVSEVVRLVRACTTSSCGRPMPCKRFAPPRPSPRTG